MLIEDLHRRQNFICCCLTALLVNLGVALYCGVSLLIRLCAHYQFDLGDVLFGLQALLPWSQDVPIIELLAVTILIVQYAWFCLVAWISSIVWRMPGRWRIMNIPDYDLRVNLLSRTCSRSDGILWRCSDPVLEYKVCCPTIIILHVMILTLTALTTPQTYVEFSAPFLPTVTLWGVHEALTVFVVAEAASHVTEFIYTMLLALSISEVIGAFGQKT